ncbi:MAG: protein BatD, partial [Nitrospinae bacterium]|nr:protein BatD [Nitrospinota bacterium]
SLPDPQLPRLKTFEIVGKSQSTEVAVVNFSATSTKRIVYEIMVPEGVKEGDYRVPVVTMTHEGKSYRAGPVDIRVDRNAPPRTGAPTAPSFPGFGAPFPGMGRQVEKDDLLVEMVPGKTEVVPYEYLTATFSFMRGVTLWEQPGYSRPTFSGFWVEDLPFEPGGNSFTRRIGGKLYHGTSLRYALAPLATGELTIDPATITVAPDPWAARLKLTTKPITVKVVDFPAEGKPASFGGMVGSYTVTAVVEPSTVAVNEGATLKLTIHGEGYLKPAPPPGKPAVDDFDLFDPKVDDRLDTKGGKLISTRVVEMPLVARAVGSQVIPPVELAWFDPATRSYVTHRTDPIPVTVVQRTISATPTVRGEKQIVPTISDAPLDDWRHPPHRQGWFWLTVALLVPLLAVAKVVGDRRRRLMNDLPYARRQAALVTARERLIRIGANDRGEGIDEAFRGYLADRLGKPVPALSSDEARQLLTGVADELVAEAVELIEALQRLRFAPPGAGEESGLVERTLRLVERLEGELP